MNADTLIALRHSKQAAAGGLIGQLGDAFTKNPELVGAGVGAVGGALTGLLPGQKVVRNALVGAGLGGTAGLASRFMGSEPTDKPEDFEDGGRYFNGPASPNADMRPGGRNFTGPTQMTVPVTAAADLERLKAREELLASGIDPDQAQPGETHYVGNAARGLTHSAGNAASALGHGYLSAAKAVWGAYNALPSAAADAGKGVVRGVQDWQHQSQAEAAQQQRTQALLAKARS